MPLSLSVLTRLQYQHESVAELIAGVPEEKLKRRLIPDKWSVFENMAHLVAYQPTFIHRLSLILQEENPLFERYSADNDPLFYEYLQKPPEELLNILANDRMAIIDILNDMSEAELDRMGQHPKYGNFTIRGWSEFFLLHEGHHLWTIFQLFLTARSLPEK